MSKFDFERVKAGEPIEYLVGNEWLKAHFVGVSKDGDSVIQVEGVHLGSPIIPCSSSLRMAPKKVTVRYRNFKSIDQDRLSVGIVTEGGLIEPGHLENMSWFKGWIHTEWQTTEIQSDLIDKEVW